MPRYPFLLLSLALSLFPVTIYASQATDAVAPEPATGQREHALVTGKQWMVTTAHPLASKAGATILANGGNAIDAMVAVQLVLGLVEPQSSGLGGGAFLLYWDGKQKQLTSFDGRETAPQAVTPRLFQDEQGQPLKFYDAVVGGRSVGTPGTVQLLWQVHQRYGKLPWNHLFDNAIELAEQGFVISPRLAAMIEKDAERLGRYSTTRSYFFDAQGQPRQAGSLMVNPEYADTLRLLAQHGAEIFYQGEIGDDIVNTVRQAKGNPGLLAKQDLRRYQAKQRPPVCSPYHEYQVCGMGPPSSGALTVGQILAITEQFDLRGWGPTSATSWQVLADASRLAFADRSRYMADADYVAMPVQGLLDSDYLRQRAKLITPGKALKSVAPGQPPWYHARRYADDESLELASTSHFNIRDRDGNLVSMTTTIENAFGSRLMVRGFLLNNELTDFSFRTHDNDRPIANQIAPGKRPRSSMAPTIVLRQGIPYLAIGSPGGSRIIGYVAQAIIAHTQWGLDIQQAINQPHLLSRFGELELEQGTEAVRFAAELQRIGYQVKESELNSGLHAIRIDGKQLQGAADPRREGLAVSDNK
ncbi:gamma-glutamyltransferase [Vibrio sp.]|uniref:gamma-glutamyltransferase n=1 Tax=Vibrio sp. TaxID=678 RepID=UPI003D0B958C